MRLLFLYGPPAAGKLTVAREVERLTGIPVFHNHLTIEMAREVIPDFGPQLGGLVSRLRLEVIETLAREGISAIFTFVYAAGKDDPFVNQIKDLVEAHGGEVCFVQLVARQDTLRARLPEASRKGTSKIKRRAVLEGIMAGNDLYSPVPHPGLALDTDEFSPGEAARRIVEHFHLPPPTPEAALRRLYRAFNARNIDIVLDAMADDVDWPNAIEGTRLHSKEPVRAYWLAQFATIDPQVVPLRFEERPDGRWSVTVHQTICDLEGETLFDGKVTHVYTFEDGRVARMEIE